MTDLDRTIAMLERRRLNVVLLAPREKRPPLGRRWQITIEPGVAERHLRSGGNLGLVAEQNGLAILDPDELLCWADMIDTLGQPCAPWVETGSGKLHYYIAWEPGLPAKLTWHGVIIGEIQRGVMQQGVIPPSVHPRTNRPYRWLVDPTTEPLPELPGEWRAYLRGRSYAYSR